MTPNHETLRKNHKRILYSHYSQAIKRDFDILRHNIQHNAFYYLPCWVIQWIVKEDIDEFIYYVDNMMWTSQVAPIRKLKQQIISQTDLSKLIEVIIQCWNIRSDFIVIILKPQFAAGYVAALCFDLIKLGTR